MAKIILKNVKMTAPNGGTIRNYESVEMDNVEMNFSENAIDFLTDENVAIFREAVKSMTGQEIVELAKELLSKPGEEISVIRKSKLSKISGYIKEVKPLVNWIIELAKNV